MQNEGSMNPTSRLASGYVYFLLREIVPKLELNWNLALSSSSARDIGG